MSSSRGKTFLRIGLSALAALLLLGLGARYWWSRNSADLIEAAKAVHAQGRLSGIHLGEGECMARSLEQHKAQQSPSMAFSVRNGLWLSGCLQASKAQDRFCDDVPSPAQVVALGVWSGLACSRNGLADPYCPNLMQHMAKYCASSQRLEKLRTRS